MRAKDLPPGTEVAVGGPKYDRRFAIVVATGPWVRRNGRWIQHPRRPVVALTTQTYGSRSIEQTRAWWTEHRDADPSDLDPLTTEPLVNVRCPWAEEAVRLGDLRRQQTERESVAAATRERVEGLQAGLERAVGLRASVFSDPRFGLRLVLLPDEVERWLSGRP